MEHFSPKLYKILFVGIEILEDGVSYRIERVITDMKKKSFVIVLIILIALFFIGQGSVYNIAKLKGYKALKVITYYNNTKLNKSSDSFQTDHFIINSRSINEKTSEEIGVLLEKSYYLIGKEFNHYPDKKTPVIIYGSMDDFWEQNKALDGQTVMGLYYMGIIHLIVPDVFDMDLYEYEKNGPVLHEYTHKVVDDICGGNIDIWFTEGLALYQEYLNYGTNWGEGLVFNNEYSIEELRDNFLSLESVQAYKQSFEIVKNICNGQKKEKIIELLKELGKGKNMEDAFLNVYGEILYKQKIDLRLSS